MTFTQFAIVFFVSVVAVAMPVGVAVYIAMRLALRQSQKEVDR